MSRASTGTAGRQKLEQPEYGREWHYVRSARGQNPGTKGGLEFGELLLLSQVVADV